MTLKNKIAIVTGGASGIGQATSILLAKEGATVVIGDLAANDTGTTKNEITQSGGQIIYEHLDATEQSSVSAFIEKVLNQFQRVDILVNNVGSVVTATTLLKSTEPDWDKTFSRNVKSVFFMSRAVLPSMMSRKSGSIINISSAAALAGRRNLAAYSAAKGAVIALTRSMAHDYGREGIRVNCVCPGPTVTPAFLRSHPSEAIRKAREEEQPLGRLGKPLDIAEAIVFLSSERASWITGVIIPVDGGNTAI